MRKLLAYFAALSLGAAAACTVHQDSAPTPSGPSTSAIAITITATPDTLPQNGTAQATVRIKAFNAGGQPLAGLPLRLDMQVNGATRDFGTLSARNVTTASDGTASAVYTAPPGPGVGGSGTVIAILATAVGGDAANQGILSSVGSLSQTFVHLTAEGLVNPPATEIPVAIFTVTPTTPTAGALALLNGSASCAGAAAGTGCAATQRVITSYVWDFGDGTTASGSVVSHRWQNPQPFLVRLTVTNDTNASATTTTVVTPGTPAGTPTAAFLALPNPAQAGETVTLDATPSTTAADGSAIVNYFWNFGDNTNRVGGSSPTTTHAFAVIGGTTTGYTISLTVTDARGRTSTITHDITINP